MTRFEAMKLKFNRGISREADTEDEDVGFDNSDFEAAIANTKQLKVGDVVTGQIIQFEKRGAIVDIGAKTTSFLQTMEASLEKVSDLKQYLNVGETREFQIIKANSGGGQFQVSIRAIEMARSWDRLLKSRDENTVLEGEVMQTNRGGAIILVENHRCFLPGSLSARPLPAEGDRVPVVVVQAEKLDKNMRVVVSHRAALAAQLTDMQLGALLDGTVRAVKPYGVFVEIGPTMGLLHVSQISHEHVADVTAVLKEGDAVRAVLISRDKSRFGLSTKVLEPEPGAMLRDPAAVFAGAHAMAQRYRERLA
eukprot:CAMPEP_0113665404 /NCGR_PEP_ID=MMETSP0038_2-20120614/2287_1 /TAXON_ID=2898 /ORGANISM="Cryptomonas paramecium" /LENGTH=307 /DNA_ID=CAMNT_0000580755 /DNA_START=118 /DNA_END=1037 /DNA_ORIENTATION=+ /assembly_acc=CAM_ASM_000170